jgi:membrane protease YdiL (CAAX protease family)
MGTTYLDLVSKGKNRRLRYLAALLLIFFFWLIIGSIPLTVVQLFFAVRGESAQPVAGSALLPGVHPLVSYLLLSFSFVAFFIGIWLAVRWIHHRPLITLIDPAGRMDWGRALQGFALWLGLSAAVSLAEALLYPGRYLFTFDPARFLLFLPFVLVLTPVQTSAEELFFRGYLIQAGGLISRNPAFLIFLSGFLFALPHAANPEVASSFVLVMLYYFGFGAFMAWLTLRDNRLELALGVHAANNLFAASIANYVNSPLPTPSIFTSQYIDPVYNLAGWLAAALVFILVFFFRESRTPAGTDQIAGS